MPALTLGVSFLRTASERGHTCKKQDLTPTSRGANCWPCWGRRWRRAVDLPPHGGPLVLRLSHSMAAGTTRCTSSARSSASCAEAATGGAVKVRVFPSGTLGQEREVVQQLQEGLVDFMVSGTAIWGSVAPRLQVFDFPFLWRDWDHVHRVVDGRSDTRRPTTSSGTVRMRPLAWGDSFGFRQVITRRATSPSPASSPASRSARSSRRST